MVRNFFEMFLRARRALEFSHSQDPKRPSHTQAFTAPACRGRFNSWRGNRFRRFISSLFLYVDNEVIIAIHAGGKTRDPHAGECTVSFRTLIFSLAAENGHRSLRPLLPNKKEQAR